MNVVILGATRGMGRALARLLAERGDHLFLLGRDPGELERSAADLVARGGVVVGQGACDLADAEGLGPAVAAAWAALDRVDAFVVTAGLFGTQEDLEADLERTRRLLTVNLTHTVVLCEHVRRRMLGQGGGTLCVFSSVAGDRGRKPVGIYGASKAGLSHYLESLDLRWRDQGLRVVCVKPGFVRTGMTAGLPEPPFASDPDPVARLAVRAMDRGTPVVYAPPIWRLVMLVIRHLPRAVMRRVGF